MRAAATEHIGTVRKHTATMQRRSVISRIAGALQLARKRRTYALLLQIGEASERE